MPRIPEYQPQVGMAAAPAARANADITNPLGSVGEGLQRFSAQLGQIGEAADDVAVTNAYLESLKRLNAVQSDLRNKMGMDAEQNLTAFAKERDLTFTDVTANLNDRQKQMFQKRFVPLAVSTEEAVGNHTRQQLFVAGAEKNQAVIAQTVNSAPLAVVPDAAGGLVVSPQVKKDLSDSINSLAKMQGWTPERKQAEYAAQMARVHDGVIDYLMASNRGASALAYFNAHEKELSVATLKQKAALTAMVEGDATAREADDWVQEKAKATGNDVAKMLELANTEVPSGKKRDAIRHYIGVKEQEINRAEAAASEKGQWAWMDAVAKGTADKMSATEMREIGLSSKDILRVMQGRMKAEQDQKEFKVASDMAAEGFSMIAKFPTRGTEEERQAYTTRMFQHIAEIKKLDSKAAEGLTTLAMQSIRESEQWQPGVRDMLFNENGLLAKIVSDIKRADEGPQGLQWLYPSAFESSQERKAYAGKVLAHIVAVVNKNKQWTMEEVLDFYQKNELVKRVLQENFMEQYNKGLMKWPSDKPATFDPTQMLNNKLTVEIPAAYTNAVSNLKKGK